MTVLVCIIHELTFFFQTEAAMLRIQTFYTVIYMNSKPGSKEKTAFCFYKWINCSNLMNKSNHLITNENKISDVLMKNI